MHALFTYVGVECVGIATEMNWKKNAYDLRW